jgi:hypothetical protein
VTRDWKDWHAPYDVPGSPLERRLRAVQSLIAAWLDARPDQRLRVVSACAGQGRDLVEVLAARPDDAARVAARLVELDPRNAAAARRAVHDAGLRDVEVVVADAGVLGAYDGAVPADLVLMCGVFGNVRDDDVRRTVAALPRLCAPGATVLWTRSRRAPDLTPAIREWFADAGFAERAFVAPDGDEWSVGAHLLTAPPRLLGDPSERMFAFEP